MRNGYEMTLKANATQEVTNFAVIRRSHPEPKEKTKAPIKKLQEISTKAATAPSTSDLIDKTLGELSEVVEELRKEKVIVIAFCSC
jgi:hypothetical protein